MLQVIVRLAFNRQKEARRQIDYSTTSVLKQLQATLQVAQHGRIGQTIVVHETRVNFIEFEGEVINRQQTRRQIDGFAEEIVDHAIQMRNDLHTVDRTRVFIRFSANCRHVEAALRSRILDRGLYAVYFEGWNIPLEQNVQESQSAIADGSTTDASLDDVATRNSSNSSLTSLLGESETELD